MESWIQKKLQVVVEVREGRKSGGQDMLSTKKVLIGIDAKKSDVTV